jgi:hypothetical protein
VEIISAKILDSTHLELSQPLNASPGDIVKLAVSYESEEDLAAWRELSKKNLLNSYSDEDAIYDEL